MRLTRRPAPVGTTVSPEGERLLALLHAAAGEAVSLAELRDHSVHAPAQAAYELQLDGYDVARVEHAGGSGRSEPGYRLRPVSAVTKSGRGEGTPA